LSTTHPWVAAQGLERAGPWRVARYHFRHILFQQYLYAHLDPVQRAQSHQRVGAALEALHAGEPDIAARLAYHFEAAGMLEEAVTYLTQAGAYAYRLSAPGDAVALYRRGLALLADLPASSSRDHWELALQMNLEGPLLVTQGWAAPARVVALERAYALAQQVQDVPRLLTTLYALSDLRTAEGKNHRALARAEQLLSLAQQVEDRGYEALGYRMTGASHFFLGHYREARIHLERGLACYAALRQGQDAPATEADLERAVFLWAWLPHVLLGLGYPEQAAARSQEALACVQPDGPVHAQAMMLTIADVSFHAMARQPSRALRDAEDLRALATEHDLVGFRGWATFFCGWARTALGAGRSALEEMATGWEDLKATNAQGSLPQLSVLLAEAYAREGEIQRSAAVLEEAHDLAVRTETSSHLAEIYRLQGELCQAADPAQAEGLFVQAIDVARAQEARLWELRAAVDLARLRQAQGRPEEAGARLGATYGWFTEGFAAPDLVEARALLDELGARPSLPLEGEVRRGDPTIAPSCS
jgi:predicted ATPase